ncbi:hypothetical protein EDD21DRAFT_410984 [Dissophora ornata]|nr:hypothetical protein BGZ58_011125 [Dissophora ornata]KAI8605622.1 hypothetical protein EDD21DRAFT_410984 [Dissophora ornata]
MKFLAAIAVAASSLVALATADMLQINNPTAGSTWTTGRSEFVGWSGNCALMGEAGKNVTVDLINGPSTAVRYVATLGQLDCSGKNTTAYFTVPNTIASGQYSIIVRTQPTGQESYTNIFQIANPSSQPAASSAAPSAATTTTGNAAASTSKPSGANSLGANVIMAFAGAAAVALQLL